MSRRLVLAAALALLAGCSSSGDLPAGPDLVSRSATAMRSVGSTHFTVEVDGELPGVTVKDAEGDLNAQGESKGRAKVEQFGQLLEVEYVLVGRDLYFKGPTGGYSKLPAALAGQVYDPTAILDPERGVAKVLADAKDAKTVSAEDGGHVVEATVPKDVVAGLVPGVGEDVRAKFTLKDDKLVNAVFELSGGAKATIALSDLNKSFTVAPPT